MLLKWVTHQTISKNHCTPKMFQGIDLIYLMTVKIMNTN